MYVDESGDCGLANSPSSHFVLSGLVLHELRWQETLDAMLEFRRRMKRTFGLLMREEIHASHMISKPGPMVRIKRNDRLTIIRHFADELAAMGHLNLLSVVVDKSNKSPDYDVFANAWRALIQRFENTLLNRNFQGPHNADDRGILFPDATDTKKLVLLLRQMRRFNPIPHQAGQGPGYRNILVKYIVEDPSFRNSASSYFIQAADLAAFLLYQQEAPSAYMRRKGGHRFYTRLAPIFCKVASRTDPQGVVRL
ncbi:MAG: DUF3800 domain-containing protein [Armatimonadota bacterium]